ncbi:MAG: YciI family protein [Alphaproteobacteria bacterium]
MEYFFYCRDKPDAMATRRSLVEPHWAFMDGYAAGMIARGPTLTDDNRITGSMHIVDVPDAAAARVFAYDEPFARADVYSEIIVHRWRNVLGRTMWQFDGTATESRFMILAHGRPGAAPTAEQSAAQHAFFEQGDPACRIILRGPLLADDGEGWRGSALFAEATDRAAVERMVAAMPFVRAGLYREVEIHRWHFGGRDNAKGLVAATRP